MCSETVARALILSLVPRFLVSLVTSANACPKSHRISSISSMPMLSRMKSGLTPAPTISSSLSWLWVVVAGWIARLLASPTFARWLKSFRLSMNRRPGFQPALDAKAEDRARALGQVLRGPRVVGMRGEAGMADPGDLRVRGEELGDALGVGDVPIHAQAQRLDALDRLPAIERRLAAAEVPQDLDPRLQDEGRRAQVGIHQPVVGRVGRGEVGEAAAASNRSCRRPR